MTLVFLTLFYFTSPRSLLLTHEHDTAIYYHSCCCLGIFWELFGFVAFLMYPAYGLSFCIWLTFLLFPLPLPVVSFNTLYAFGLAHKKEREILLLLLFLYDTPYKWKCCICKHHSPKSHLLTSLHLIKESSSQHVWAMHVH